MNNNKFEAGDRFFLLAMAMVYKILSPCLKECYVGSTTRHVEKRWSEHRSKSNLCSSRILLDKYGVKNCKFIVLEVCPLEERFEKEQWWLDHSVGAVNKIWVISDVEKHKARDKQYYEENKEECLQYQKQYYEANKEKHSQYQKQYYEANKEEYLQYQKQYCEANKEEYLQYQKQYYEANKENIKEQRKQKKESKAR